MFEITKNNINLLVDDNIIGYILYDEKDDYIVGSHIYLEPDERGKGYSGKLLEKFVDFVREKDKLVVATCPVIKRFLESNYQELLK